MRSDALARRAEELAAQGAAFATATVVRAQRPTSARAGNVALVLSDGSIDGFVGGVCAEHSVRLYAMKAMKSGEPLLLRILPTAGDAPDGEQELTEDGAVTVQNTCLSGGAIEVFVEPVLPAPRVHIVGDTPIAGALERSGPELGLDIVAAHDSTPDLQDGDLAVVVAAHGKGELEAVRRALEASVPRASRSMPVPRPRSPCRSSPASSRRVAAGRGSRRSRARRSRPARSSRSIRSAG